MKRSISIAALLVAAAACTDQPQHPTAPVRGPMRDVIADSSAAPAGTAAASSICVSYTATRDSLAAALAQQPGNTDLQSSVNDWNAVLASHCN